MVVEATCTGVATGAAGCRVQGRLRHRLGQIAYGVEDPALIGEEIVRDSH